MAELNVDPDPTAGPNNPTDPPNPTVIGARRSCKYPLIGGILPSSLESEYRTNGMADLMSFLIINLVII